MLEGKTPDDLGKTCQSYIANPKALNGITCHLSHSRCQWSGASILDPNMKDIWPRRLGSGEGRSFGVVAIRKRSF